MISLKSLGIGTKARGLRGMPRFRFVGGAGETREGMVRSTGGESGKKVSGKLRFPKKLKREVVKKSKMQSSEKKQQDKRCNNKGFK